MDRDEALKLLRGGPEGIAEWNRRRESGEQIPDLSVADLRGADLSRAVLYRADLSGADLSGATLYRADLRGAVLRRSDLNGAVLRGAVLRGADLSGAALRGANLRGVYFRGVDLSGADFSEARCIHTVFADVDLSRVGGLETTRHAGPSTIGTDTLFRSRGKIPESFLRGCGVREPLIEYLPSLIGSMSPIQLYSCFISYSSRNQDFANLLHADLQAKGVRCWFDREDLKIGDKIRHRIAEAIHIHDKLMLVLTEQSIASDWVESEVEVAFEREGREKRIVLFPIRLDDAIMDSPVGWVSHIRRTRHIGDFTGWKDHDAFQKSFDRLLRDLRASEEGK